MREEKRNAHNSRWLAVGAWTLPRLRQRRKDKGAKMRSAHNSHWWAPDAWTPPRIWVCRSIQVFGGYRDLAPVEECGIGPCSRGRHSLLMQHSTQRRAPQSQQRRTTEQSRTTHTRMAQDSATPRHTELAEAHKGAVLHSTHQRSMRVQGLRSAAHSAAEQSRAAHHNGGRQPQHALQTPTLAQHPTPQGGC